jgi:hypothetical protein
MVAQNIGNWGGKDLEKRHISEIASQNPTDFLLLLREMVRKKKSAWKFRKCGMPGGIRWESTWKFPTSSFDVYTA